MSSRSLLERDSELAALTALIERAAAADAATCVIEGPPGIGKSRLVAEARAIATEHGAAVLSASASELERGFGFGVAVQLLEPAVRNDHDRLLAGAAAPARLIVGPERTHASDTASDPSFAALDGLYWLTLRLAEQRPLVLTIDDLQWCDSPTLRYLAYLRVRLEGLPVLILAGIRPVEAGTDAALDDLLGDPATVLLRPRPLTVQATAALLERSLGGSSEPEFTSAVHRATAGNPLLLRELMTALAEERARPDAAHLALLEDLGPSSIAHTVFLRLRRMGGAETSAAQALAVLGEGADLAAVAALADLDVGPAGKAVGTLARSEVLRPDPPLGFVHPLVAAAIYRDIPPGERELRHLRAAELLQAASAPPEQVATHLLHAPVRGEPWVVQSLVEAALVATRKGAADGAGAYLERALAEPPAPEHRAEISLQLGKIQATRNGPAAERHLRIAYSQLTDPSRRAQAAEWLGRVLLFTGSADEGLQVIRTAAAELPQEQVVLREQLEALESFGVLFGSERRDELRRLERHRHAPGTPGLGGRMLAAITALQWMYDAGPSDRVARLALAALADGELVTADSGWAATFPITTLTNADRDEAEHWWEKATAAAHRHGSLPDISAITLWRANALRRRGELADAERSVRECLSGVTQWGYTEPALLYCHAQLAAVLRERGELTAARQVLSGSRVAGMTDDGTRAWLGSSLELLLAEGAFEDAVAAADAYAERFDDLVRNPVDVPWRSIKALALHRLGRSDQAAELVLAELELARAWGAPATVARSLRSLGTIRGRDGVAHLEEAVATVGGSPARLEHARSLAALGTALHRTGAAALARVPLREALALASMCGAAALAERTRSELHAAGGRPRRTALFGVDALTASEGRVVALVAEGRTNREVGEALFVTPKTVAMHLSNAYRKLGVTSRGDLAAVIAAS